MYDRKIHFIGFLSNVDASILQLDLDHGFKIETLSEDEAVDLMISALRIPDMSARIVLGQIACLNYQERCVYVVSNSLGTDAKTRTQVYERGHKQIEQFDNGFFIGYLSPTIRLVRLFKEGDIRIPLTCYYIKDVKPSLYRSSRSGRHVSREPYHLVGSELRDLQMFLQNTKIPFERAFLQLAFENFELSYEIPNIGLSFLTLMMSLETLLNPGEAELTYRISRNAAVLLGNNKKKSATISSEIQKLYKKRSSVVHTGNTRIIEKADLLKLRHYVRKSIRKMHLMRKSKDEILERLNSYGFGRARSL